MARLSRIIPWDELQTIYESGLSSSQGSPSIPARVAVGALIIKHISGLTDEETIESIRENPYYQYFLGYHSFTDKPVFTPSLFVAIRKRLGHANIQKVTDMLIKSQQKSNQSESKKKDNKGGNSTTHKGMLIIDATVAPSDIAFPTDTNLLNHAREISENLIDILWRDDKQGKKPRTYRRVARNEYLAFTRFRRKSQSRIRKMTRKQLGYLERNIRTIQSMLIKKGLPLALSNTQLRQLWIITEFCRQQREMYDERKHYIEGRIVSLQQPHIRPIVRGKAGTKQNLVE